MAGLKPQADLAQLVAHHSCKVGVTGSSPVVGSVFFLVSRAKFGNHWAVKWIHVVTETHFVQVLHDHQVA
jgi:hypothetical protein